MFLNRADFLLPTVVAVLSFLTVSGCASEPTAPATADTTGTLAERKIAATHELVRCLAERGYQVAFGGPGQFSGEVPPGQMEAFLEDQKECTHLHMANLGTFEINSDVANAYFDALDGSAICLRDLGFQISEPPSRAMLVEAALQNDLTVWDPFTEVILGGFEDSTYSYSSMLEQCPRPEVINFVD